MTHNLNDIKKTGRMYIQYICVLVWTGTLVDFSITLCFLKARLICSFTVTLKKTSDQDLQNQSLDKFLFHYLDVKLRFVYYH